MRYLYFIFVALILTSCSSEVDNQLLLGNWKTVAWTKLSTGEKMENKMDFQFTTDSRYEVDYGSISEKGKYWINNDYLHTIEDGQSEKKVKITSLSQDSMVFEMNRAGEIEKVILVRD